MYVNKFFRYQLEKCTHTTFGELTQSFIKSTLSKKTSVLALIMLYKKIGEKHKKVLRVISCVIYTIVKNYVYIDFLDFQNNLIKWNNCGF